MNLRNNLEARFSDVYRRIWIFTTRKNTLQLILFPVNKNENYKIVTKENFGQITEERLALFIESIR